MGQRCTVLNAAESVVYRLLLISDFFLNMLLDTHERLSANFLRVRIVRRVRAPFTLISKSANG